MSALPIPAFFYAVAAALAVAFLVLLSTLICRLRLRLRHRRRTPPPIPQTIHTTGVRLPTVFFMPEDGDPNRPDSPTGVVGLDPAIINSYPKFQFLKSRENLGARECSICLCEYREGEMMRMMPDCRHAFHLFCLDAWLRLNGSCPVCRCSPLPTPLSTPLAEVVPLAQFGDSRRWRSS